MSQFQVLVRTFLGRFFDNEMTGGSNDLKASFIWLISFLAAPGAFMPWALMYRWDTIAVVRGHDELRAAAQGDVVLFIGLAMIATAIVSTLVWNALLLDHRDGMILGAMPVRGGTIVRAKLAALVIYVGATTIATSLLGSLAFGFLLAAGSTVLFAIRNALALFVASSAACALVFGAVVAAQGLLLVLLGPRRFARVSPPLQSVLVGSVLLALLAMPTISGSLVSTLHNGFTLQFNWEALSRSGIVVDAMGPIRPWIIYTPPVWFLGLHEWLLGSRDPFFAILAANAGGAAAIALLLAAASYPLAYRRVMTSVVEQSAGFGRVGRMSAGVRALAWALSRQPEVRAMAAFFLATVARVERQRLVMAVAAGAALAWGVPTILGITHAGVPALDAGWLGLPLVTAVCLIAGLRVAASLPSDLRGAWLFDVQRPSRLQIHVALERTMLVAGVAPVTLASGLLSWRWFGADVAVVQAAFTVAAASFLIQILLWRTDDVPCAAAWQPERANLRKWWPAYLIGFFFFAEALPNLEVILVQSPVAATWFTSCFGLVAIALRRAELKRPVDSGDDSVGVLASALHTERHRPPSEDDDEAGLRGVERLGAAGARGMFGSNAAPHVSWRARMLDALGELARVPGRLPRDAYMALRRLLSAPAFTFFSIVTLALAIGATTAVYSLIYSMMWRDVGIRDIDHVAGVYLNRYAMGRGPQLASLSWPDYQDLSASQTTLASLSAWANFPTSLSGGGSTTLISGEGVSGGGFDVVHVPIALGRAITPDDDRPDAPPVMVLSDAVWRNQFHADPHVVGQVAKLGTRAFDVIGVAPASFLGITTRYFDRPAVWVPLSAVPPMLRAIGYPLDTNNRRQTWLIAIGRMSNQVPIDRASMEIVRIGRQLDEAVPLAPALTARSAARVDYRRQWYAASISQAFTPNLPDQAMGWVVVAIPGLVLLVACTNLANLVLSRGASRRQELAIRQALGNSRAGVIRELLVEHGVIAVIGAGLGLVIAHSLLVWVAGVAQESFGYMSRYRIPAHLEPAVVSAALVTAVLALVISGLMPALQLTRGGAGRLIANHASHASPAWRGRSQLIAGQVAVSVGLLLISAFFVRIVVAGSAERILPPGLERVALVNVSFGMQLRTQAQTRQVIDRVLQELRETPGIQSASATSLSDQQMSAYSQAEISAPEQPLAAAVNAQHTKVLVAATPGLWRTLNIAIRSGRAFDETDLAGGRVAVVDETAARQTFGTVEVVGRTMLLRPSDYRNPRAAQSVETRTIIGVARDSDLTDRQHKDGVVYVPFSQHYEGEIAILARSATDDVASPVGAIRTALRHADPELAVSLAGRADVVSRFGAEVSLGLVTRASIALAFMALGMAMTGLYGVLSHIVSRRTRELGIRVALGAEPQSLSRMVMRDGLRPVAFGLAIGLGASILIRQALQTQLSKPIDVVDLTAFAIAMVPLVAAALVACYVPARRAARVSPSVALRNL